MGSDHAKPADAVEGRLLVALDRFVEAMLALRDLHEFAQSHEEALEGESAVSRFLRERVKSLPDEERRRVQNALLRWSISVVRLTTPESKRLEMEVKLRALEGTATSDGPTDTINGTPQEGADGAGGKGSPPRDLRAEFSAAFTGVLEAIEDPHSAADFIRVATIGNIRVKRVGMLRSSLVTSAVTAFEVLLSAIATNFYRLHNDALGTRKSRDGEPEKDFSFEELKTYTSIQDAIDALIERRVDGLLREGLDDWVAWFERNLNVKLPELAGDWPSTIEVFQRRHLFVHTGGHVTKQYVRMTGQDVPSGSQLGASRDYVDRSFDLLTVLGVLVVATTAVRLFKDRAERISDHINSLVYTELMQKNHWGSVEPICKRAMSFCPEESGIHIFRVNGWLARKRTTGTIEQVRAQVEAWDTSALNRRFRIAKLALLDDFEAALPELKTAVDQKEIDGEELATWPLLAELRAHPRFAEFFPPAATLPGDVPATTDLN